MGDPLQVSEMLLAISCCMTLARVMMACWSSLGPAARNASTDSTESHCSKMLIRSASMGSAERWKSEASRCRTCRPDDLITVVEVAGAMSGINPEKA